MISVGVDVSKGKSTVCILKPYGEVVSSPFEIMHTEKELSELTNMILRFDDETRVVMEFTGIYHQPVLNYLQKSKIFVTMVNPFEMKQYRSKGLRQVKTDKQDSIEIARFGLDNWFYLKNYESGTRIYEELKLLGRQYRHYMTMKIESIQTLTHMLDYTMPGIKGLISGYRSNNGKDKLSDFVDKYWHFDNITKMSEKRFINSYVSWCKSKGYHQSKDKAVKIYTLAKDGIPTLQSTSASVKMLVLEAVRVLHEVNKTLAKILTQMQELSKSLPEYSVVRAMGGVGEVLAPKLIAEIGDVRRFHSGKALIAYAGIDAPPFQSGKFIGTERKISKRGSSNLRKIGYEVMKCLKSIKKLDDYSVQDFILKKEREGKHKRVAKIAGLNKFLRIYYARVMEVYD